MATDSLGWDLNLGAIERKVMQGFFDFEDKTDRLSLVTQSGSQELYPAGVHGNEGEWRLKTNEGLPPKIRSAEGYVDAIYPTQVSWLVTDPDGTKHYYGTTESSWVKAYVSGAARNHVRYCLDRVEDGEGTRQCSDVHKSAEVLYEPHRLRCCWKSYGDDVPG
jgi:hypothetical protein